MINFLTGRYQKHVAWFLFFVFYGELAASLHASKGTGGYAKPVISFNSYYTPVYSGAHVRQPAMADITATENKPVAEAPVVKTEVPAIVDEPVNQDKGNIGGPGQLEMNTFKSVGSDNMVNLFTGDFSYNIPLLDVGGYPVNIFYNAGATMDQEASWVGLGWNINPGTVNRNMRGLPDDYNGQDSITKIQSIKPDRTIGVEASTGGEVFGNPGLSGSIKAGIFYNNRRGLGLEVGAGLDYSLYKLISDKAKDDKTKKDTTIREIKLSGGIDLNSQTGMGLNGGFSITKKTLENKVIWGFGTSLDFNSRQGLADMRLDGEFNKYKYDEEKKESFLAYHIKHQTTINFARSSFAPSIRMPLTTANGFYMLKLGDAKNGWFKHGTIAGYVQETRLDAVDTLQKKPAYGYMYYELGNEDKNRLLDFNRLNDGVYAYKTPVISVPVYTYDVFSINGEGTGGSFRGFRGNMGYMRDHDSRTKSGSVNITLDLGGEGIFHGGTILGGVYSKTFVSGWESGNTLARVAAFNKTDGIYQSFYFKNPGEKAIIDENYYEKMGRDQLVRPYLGGTNTGTPHVKGAFQVIGKDRKVERTVSLSSADSYRQARDKRTQVITYLTAEDADKIGLDKYIYSYTENLFQPGTCANSLIRTPVKRYNPNDPGFYRKAHHISEVDVLEPDGRRYVYGIPVYQVKQKEVVFSTESMPEAGGDLVGYSPTGNNPDNSTRNNKGRDGFFQSETINGYAHSYLLTGILSPDYVDVTDDGITDDDLGTAIRFNYSRVNKMKHSLLGLNYWHNFKWRMPAEADKANYNEGLKADSRDDKGLYTYGEKELWYLHSIESKNMVATFHVSDRNDGKQVNGENGGIANGSGQKKLVKINLYTKADYAKYGSNARPVKTVHFKYSYKLCQNFALNNSTVGGEKGKLTLDAIWFSYNGNANQVKNKYAFKYAASNPAYTSGESDRWGTYKSHLENPEVSGTKVSNRDFPYTLQNTAISNDYATAWNLEQILLPGGAVVKVQYEADDYAFVQDKRASQMTKIAGFGKTSTSTPSDELYAYDPLLTATPAKMDYRFVFFDSPTALTNKQEIKNKYLQDLKQLLLKVWIKMPRGNIGNEPAYEPVIIYGVIKDYGVVSGNPNRFYVELEETKKDGSPVMETAIQFLKDHLPGRAYPGYEVNGDGALLQVVRAVFGLMNSYTQGVMGFERDLKLLGKCKKAQLSMSFARLNNPDYKKIGGGHRVKKVTINDNWNRMTGQFESQYGQLYDYTNTEMVNGQKITISSGVASYEPGVGNEENPFREALKYSEKQFLGPTDHSTVELPFAETFFPSPMVGYSKVSVKSIHNKDDKNIKSGIGLQQTEFYTTRHFPVISEFTDFDEYSRHRYKPLLQRVFNFAKRDHLALTQGFRIVLNDMNGKMKSQTSFAENDYTNPINYTAHYYRLIPRGNNKYKLDNVLPVISGPDGKITNKLIGKDIEVMNDFREHFSFTHSANIPLNAEFFTVANFPVLIPTVFRMVFRDESMYRSATTLKIVNEYGILDSVVNIDKGSVVGTKNLVYDAESGNVLISRTNNEFKKPIYQFSYPAWWVQTGMEPAYRNVDLTYSNVLFRNGRIEESPHVNMDYFESGDEIFIEHNNNSVMESNACIIGGYPIMLPASAEYKVWALDIRKDTRNVNEAKEFLFIDRYGNPYNAANATIRIIRSGKRNLVGASVGSIVSLNNPIRTVEGQDRVVIDNATDVINASAAEFKEKWRVNDMFYVKSEFTDVVRKTPVHTLNASPIATSSITYYKLKGMGGEDYPYKYNKDFLLAYTYKNREATVIAKSWAQFDLSTITSQKTILSASLSLYSHKHFENGFNHWTHNYWPNHETSHGAIKPHTGRNDYSIKRMLTTWPGNNMNTWKSYLFNAAVGDVATQALGGPTTAPPYNLPVNDLSYCESCSPAGADNRFNLKRMVEAMISDRDNPAKNFATAIQLETSLIDDHPKRVCFNSGMLGPNNQKPILAIKYYDCTEAYGLPGNPATPPEGVETADCVSREWVTSCLSVFSKTKMNPYIEGVLGNWRGWRSYVYYGERRESDPTTATDIRKDGVIKDYESYWSFAVNPDDKLTKTNSTKWVWNAEITQYNRKGAELENHDPLGRYNAGIYGYQESLPIAVVNNSRLRLSAFDGFEDYYYQDDPCEPFCKPSKRHFATGITTNMLDATQSHTGKYSVKIAANATHQMDVEVSADDET